MHQGHKPNEFDVGDWTEIYEFTIYIKHIFRDSDNLKNKVNMTIGKFSKTYCENKGLNAGWNSLFKERPFKITKNSEIIIFFQIIYLKCIFKVILVILKILKY